MISDKDLMMRGLRILKVLEYAHQVNAERLVYASSGCGGYDLESKIPFEEHDVIQYSGFLRIP